MHGRVVDHDQLSVFAHRPSYIVTYRMWIQCHFAYSGIERCVCTMNDYVIYLSLNDEFLLMLYKIHFGLNILGSYLTFSPSQILQNWGSTYKRRGRQTEKYLFIIWNFFHSWYTRCLIHWLPFSLLSGGAMINAQYLPDWSSNCQTLSRLLHHTHRSGIQSAVGWLSFGSYIIGQDGCATEHILPC